MDNFQIDFIIKLNQVTKAYQINKCLMGRHKKYPNLLLRKTMGIFNEILNNLNLADIQIE